MSLAIPSLRLEEHVFRVLEGQDKLTEFLGEHDWNFSMSDEVLRFSDAATGTLRATCPVQLIGTESKETNTFLWAWANQGSDIPAGLLRGVTRVRDKAAALANADPVFQQVGEIPLRHERFGGELAIICAGYLDLFTYYACSYAGGVLYAAIETCPGARQIPADALRKIRVITAGIQALTFDHQAAVRAYLGEPVGQENDTQTFAVGDEQIRVRFDAQGRIAEMNAVLRPDSGSPPPFSASLFGKMKRLLRNTNG